MRHRGGADLPGLYLLFEILHAHIHPHIPVEVEHNRVNTFQGIEQGCKIIVVRNLGCVFLPFYAEAVAKESCCKCRPVDVGISRMVCVEIAGSPAELAAHRHSTQLPGLLTQTIYIYHKLLAKTCRRSRLPVGFGKHRYIGPFPCTLVERINQIIQQRQVNLMQCIA